MISNLKQLLVFYFISFAIFWTNGNNTVEDKSSCSGYIGNMLLMEPRVQQLQSELNMLRNNGLKRKPLPNILDVKCANDRLPSNCYEVRECQKHYYRVEIPNFAGGSFPVLCVFKTEHEAWTVIQRRRDGSVNFNRNWREYVFGFGDLNGEFFIGLEKLHALTTMGADQELFIILEDFEGDRKYALYNTFRVESEANGYRLTVDGYSGDAGDSLSYHNGCTFSTPDRDTKFKCATLRHAGWWYDNCFESNLNGMYLSGKTDEDEYGVAWQTFRGTRYSLKITKMMIRPRQNQN